MQEVIISEKGSVLCYLQSCQYRKECANHETAGDFRSEGGFSPVLVLGKDDKQILCLSSYVKSDEDKYDPKPIGHHEQGYVSTPINRDFGDLEIMECDHCITSMKDYIVGWFEILIDKKTNKLYKKCKYCRKISDIIN